MRKSKVMLLLALCLSVCLAVCLFAVSCGHEHVYYVRLIEEPTETATGTARETCFCGESQIIEVPALTDTSVWSVKSTDDAGHVEDGSKVYTSDRFGDVTVTLPATGHTAWGEWEITKDPTAEKEGTAQRTCSCGEVEKFTLPNLSDTSFWSVKSTQDPTHTEDGETVYTSDYGDVTVAIPATGHTEWGEWEIIDDPTAEKEGTAQRTCSCGEVEKFTLPNLSDTSFWSVKSTQDPTHTEDGETVYTSDYGDVTVTIPATGHTEWGEWEIIDDPTAEKEGTAQRTCSCGEVEKFTLPNLSDTSFWSESVTPADFTHGTIHTYTSDYGTVTVEDDDTVPYPYLGKTYTAVELDASTTDKVISAGTSWNTASLTIGEDGLASGSAFPFRNHFQFELVNVATGELRVTTWAYSDTDKTGDSTTYTAWVDMNSGIIILPRNGNLNDVFLMTPFESGMSSSAVKASAWQGAMAVAYTVGENTYTVFIQGNRAYFGVSFVDKDGQSVAADACFTAPTLYIKDAEGNTLAGYAFNGTKEVPVDGLEGDYTVDGKTLWLSGFGTLTYDGQNGTYARAAEDAGYDLDVYFYNEEGVAVQYYHLTFGDERTATLATDKVNLTFDCGGVCTDPAAVSVDRNIAYTLPVPADTATKIFRGWKLADGTLVGASYVPTADTALTAYWITKSTVTLVDVLDGDPTTLYLGVGDTLANALPAYTVDEEGGRLFVSWYIDMNGNGAYDKGTDVALEADATIGETDLAITVIAVWQSVPAYYGTYYGVELWGLSSGNSSMKTLTIDAAGVMSGLVTGQVVSYDPVTQVLVYTKNSSSTTYTCFFDAENKIFAGIYGSTHIGSDFYLLTTALTATDYKVTNRTSIKCLDPLGTSTSQAYYIHLFTVNTRNGEKNICLYADHIYADVTVATTDGTALTVGTAATGKTIVVRDAAGNMIFALASKTGGTISSNDTVALDAYFGSYSDGADGTVVLDGAGAITWGEKTGTYEKVGDGFAVYFLVDGVRTEYYDMTLDTAAGTCQLNKPIVTVTLDAGGKATVENFTDINKNIPIRLPAPEATAYFFRGWYVQGDASQTLVSLDYVPTESVTLVAKWDNKYSLTIHRNNGTDTEVIYYGEGDTMQVDKPVYDGYRFVGWYTSVECTEGTEWTSGVTVTANVEIYALWAVAPAYTGTYPYCLEFDDSGTGTETGYKRTVTMVIDPEGTGSGTSYPVRGDITIQNYNSETGYLEVVVGTTVYSACYDPVTRVIVMNSVSGADKALDRVFVFIREEAATSGNISSYWDDGATRAITWTAAAGTAHNIFIKGGKAYFDVSFLDGANAETAAPVSADACYQAPALFVYASDGTLIAKYGYNGEAMMELDGYEGDYTVVGTGLTVHVTGYGELTFAGVNGTYEKLPDGTFAVYTYDAAGNIDGYHVATLDTAAYTATVQTPTVTVSYVTEYGTQPGQVVVNMNVPLTLPADLQDDAYVFRGWYVQGDETQTLYQTYAPTADVVLVAKWDAKVTVTVVYGNGLANETVAYGVGDTVVLVAPPYTAGQCFSHWYTLAPDGTTKVEYTPGTLTENLTVYAAWMDAVPQYGDYKYANVYSEGRYDRSFKSALLSVAPDGTVTSSAGFAGNIEQIDETHFKIVSDTKESYFAYDPVTGVMVSAYSSGQANVGIDMYVYIPVAGLEGTSVAQYKHFGSRNRVLFSYELEGVTHYGLVWCDGTDGSGAHIWGDITWDASLTATEMSEAAVGTTVNFRQGEATVLTITKTSDGWTVVTE